MRRLRALSIALAAIAAPLVLAPAALAIAHGGQGIYGETSDTTITNTMFLTIAFFAVIIVIFSLLQTWLEHRKHARMDAAKRRAASIDWRGGW